MRVAVVEMVGLGIVIVDCEFDKSQAKNAGVEIQIPLRVARNRRHMMDAEYLFAHVMFLRWVLTRHTFHILLGIGEHGKRISSC